MDKALKDIKKKQYRLLLEDVSEKEFSKIRKITQEMKERIMREASELCNRIDKSSDSDSESNLNQAFLGAGGAV